MFLSRHLPLRGWGVSNAIKLVSLKTRSTSACHVGPLALERVIIFAQLLCYEKHLNFLSSLNTLKQVLNKFLHI